MKTMFKVTYKPKYDSRWYNYQFYNTEEDAKKTWEKLKESGMVEVKIVRVSDKIKNGMEVKNEIQ